MVLRLEVEFPRLAHATDLDVLGVVLADGHLGSGRLRNREHQPVELGLDLLLLGGQRLDLLLDAVRLLQRRCALGLNLLGRHAVGDRPLVPLALGVLVEGDLRAHLLLLVA